MEIKVERLYFTLPDFKIHHTKTFKARVIKVTHKHEDKNETMEQNIEKDSISIIINL
jgi:hypothetical protein